MKRTKGEQRQDRDEGSRRCEIIWNGTCGKCGSHSIFREREDLVCMTCGTRVVGAASRPLGH